MKFNIKFTKILVLRLGLDSQLILSSVRVGIPLILLTNILLVVEYHTLHISSLLKKYLPNELCELQSH